MFDLTLLGGRFRSALNIVGLPAWAGPETAPFEFELEFGPVPQQTPQHPVDVIVLDNGDAVVVAEGVGRFMVSGGRTIIADPASDALPGAVETTVMGPILGTLCYQRGIQALHCNTVVIQGQAIALSGHSGAGKSTLAAVLASRGHPLISDDVLAVTPSAAGPIAHTGNRELRLWRETLELLGHDVSALRRAAPGARDKYFLPPQSRDIAATWPLKALVWLERLPAETEQIELLGGVMRVQTIVKATYRRHLAAEYNRRGNHSLSDLSLRGADVYQIRRPRDLGRLDLQADAIEALAMSVRSPLGVG